VRVGYLLGGVTSLVLFRVNRREVISLIKWWLESNIKSKSILQGAYIGIILLVTLLICIAPESEIVNALVAFGVLEIAGTSRGINCKNSDARKFFYNTLVIIGKSFIGSFIAPLIILVTFGNAACVAYGLLYYLSDELDFPVGEKLLNILYIVPSIIGGGLLYIVYIFRNKTVKIDFKGEFFQNLMYMPLLNIYILGAYIESVNFYYIENKKVVHYLRSYGGYQGKIDDIAIKDLVTIIYGVAGVAFIIFLTLINLM